MNSNAQSLLRITPEGEEFLKDYIHTPSTSMMAQSIQQILTCISAHEDGCSLEFIKFSFKDCFSEDLELTKEMIETDHLFEWITENMSRIILRIESLGYAYFHLNYINNIS